MTDFTDLTVSPGGQITLPRELLDRYRLNGGTAVRIVETRSGILLVPLTGQPMSQELASELAEWQSLASSSWDLFPYDEDAV